MSIEVGIWKLGERLEPIGYSRMESESRLESLLADDIAVVDPGLLLIGRQVSTAYGKFIDLLAIDSDGRVVVLELKRDRTPREVVAQLLDYGSWVRELEDDDLASILAAFCVKHCQEPKPLSLDEAFRQRFGSEVPETFNDAHKLVLVASELDESSERIITYLADEYGVAINAVFFRVFTDDGREYLTRAWLSDPETVEARAEAKQGKRPWNGECYSSFGADENRDWEEARKYGFISAGGGKWYSQTLSMFDPGDRVWINIPGGTGYVGVGEVVEPVVPIDEFMVDNGSGQRVPITTLPLKAARHTTMKANPEKAEHLVRIKWLHTVPIEEAVKEKGFFGNQNSAAKPRDKKWQHTVERLAAVWGIDL